MARQNSIMSEMCETDYKNPPRQTASVWSPIRWRQHKDFFALTHPPVGQKTSLVIFEHKITTSASNMDSIGTGYTSHDTEICMHGKRLKNNLSIKLDLYSCRDETYEGEG